jgi:hypothetical protein
MALAPAAGERLDRAVWNRLGRPGPECPEYSSCDEASRILIQRLERAGYRCELQRDNGEWRCTWSSRQARLSTGSGRTRALAVARAASNLRLPRYWWARDSEGELSRPDRCEDCGQRLPGGRGALKRFCNLCGWAKTRAKLTASSRIA